MHESYRTYHFVEAGITLHSIQDIFHKSVKSLRNVNMKPCQSKDTFDTSDIYSNLSDFQTLFTHYSSLPCYFDHHSYT